MPEFTIGDLVDVLKEVQFDMKLRGYTAEFQEELQQKLPDLGNAVRVGGPRLYAEVLNDLPRGARLDPAANLRFVELCGWLKTVAGLSIDVEKFTGSV